MKPETDHLSRLDPLEKRLLLIEALSYIQGFKGETAVIKYGGAAMVKEEFKVSLAQDIVLLRSLGIKPVIVHGGGPEISAAIKQYGLESNFIDGLRVTDLPSMKISEMALSGSVNKGIVALLNNQGGDAVGLSGKDGRLIEAEKMDHPSADLGYVGKIKQVNPAIIHTLMDNGYIPVVSPISMGLDGNTYNINADTAAAHIGAALKAQKIIFLTDVKGIMKDDALISELNTEKALRMIDDGDISGGMIPKVRGMLHALEQGVGGVHIICGTEPHALIAELFTQKGTGTMIVK